jgi:hypothetical protein
MEIKAVLIFMVYTLRDIEISLEERSGEDFSRRDRLLFEIVIIIFAALSIWIFSLPGSLPAAVQVADALREDASITMLA